MHAGLILSEAYTLLRLDISSADPWVDRLTRDPICADPTAIVATHVRLQAPKSPPYLLKYPPILQRGAECGRSDNQEEIGR
jgi:hypothetical protein